MNNARINGFGPIWRSDAVVLICGSMPSIVSLERSFYYGHPRNIFWPMMAEILGEDHPQSNDEKSEMLRKHKIALWDTCASCEREGSLDSAIRNVNVNDFSQLYTRCPDIHTILFNGSSAMELYRRYVCKADPERTFCRLPSTSPAYTLAYEKKKFIWSQAIMEVLKL